MRTFKQLALLCMVCCAPALHAAEQPAGAGVEAQADPRQQLLQKMYALRMRLEQERARAENEARANVRLVSQANPATIDSPTVSALRQQTDVKLTQLEQTFRCLDVNANAGGGNSVIVCGDNSGDIRTSNITADGDVVNIEEGSP